MSSSKEAAAVEEQRQPKCCRCRNHGVVVRKKGHTKCCPFLQCGCWKCSLGTRRTLIQKSMKIPGGGAGAGKPAAKGALTAVEPEGGPRSSATSGLMCPPAGTSSHVPVEGEHVDGVDPREGPPLTSREKYTFYIGGLPAPLPVVHLPFWMPGLYPGSICPPPPEFLLSPSWLPPIPAELCNSGLHGATQSHPGSL